MQETIAPDQDYLNAIANYLITIINYLKLKIIIQHHKKPKMHVKCNY